MDGSSRIARLIGYDGGMRFQFTIRTLLLAFAFGGLSLWGFLHWHYRETHSFGRPPSLLNEVSEFFYEALIWVPLIFLAYAIGRKALTVRIVIVFGVAEASAIGHWYSLF
jgi:hypothetical protein